MAGAAAHINSVALGAGCLWVLENNLQDTSVVRAFSALTGREVAA